MVSAAILPPRLKRGILLCLSRFRWLLAILGLHLHPYSLCLSSQGLFSPSVSLSTFPSTNTGILDEGPTRNQHDLLLTHTLITSAVTLFPNKVMCTGPGVRAPTYLLGTHFNP